MPNAKKYTNSNTPLDWGAVDAFITAAEDKQWVYNETKTVDGVVSYYQSLIKYDGTQYICARMKYNKDINASVLQKTAIYPLTIGIGATSEDAYNAAVDETAPEID